MRSACMFRWVWHESRAQTVQTETSGLGCEVSHDYIYMRENAMKTDTIPVPRCKRDVQSFASFFRSFMPRLADDCALLCRLQGEMKFE